MSVPVEANAQEEENGDFPHPLSKDFLEDAEHSQDKNEDEHTVVLEDKPAESEDTTDTNQLDHNNENTTNGFDPALLQSDEPKSKVINGTLWDYYVTALYYCICKIRFQIARKNGKIQM